MMATFKISFLLALLATHVVGKLDVVFLLDTSASFTVDLAIFQPKFLSIMTDIRNQVDGDSQFGVAVFQDYGILPFGTADDVPYELVADLQDDFANVTSQLAGQSPVFGNDMMESALTAVFQALTGDGQDFGQGDSIPSGKNMQFRDGATKIVVLWTDGGFQDPVDTPGYPGPNFTSVITELTSTDFDPPIRFVGLSRTDDASAIADLGRLADPTGSKATQDFECYDGKDIDEGGLLVCDGVGADVTVICDAFVNMVAEAWEIDNEPFVPLTCGGLYAGVCLVSGAIASILSCFT